MTKVSDGPNLGLAACLPSDRRRGVLGREQYEKAWRASLVLGDASPLAEREDLLESNLEHLTEFVHALWVVPLSKLTIQSSPRNESRLVHRNPVQALRPPTLIISRKADQ